jgi:DNA modification methylase
MAGCPKGGVVLDPFMGSGTTALVAYKHDRKFLGIELNKKYLDEITIPRIKCETRQLKLF